MNVNVNTSEGTIVEVQIPQRVAVSVVDRGSIQAFQVDKTFVHDQTTSSDTWSIAHNLGKYPSVMIVDSDNQLVGGGVEYVDTNNVTLTFKGAFKGKAFFN